MDLSDLKEFKGMDPNIRKFYKAYIVDGIIPLVIKHFNILLTTSKEYSQLNDKKKMDKFLAELNTELEKSIVEFIHLSQTSS